MAPRRLILVDFSAHQRTVMLDLLKRHFSVVPVVTLTAAVAQHLCDLLENAAQYGAQVIGEVCDCTLRPLLVLDGRPEMKLAQTHGRSSVAFRWPARQRFRRDPRCRGLA